MLSRLRWEEVRETGEEERMIGEDILRGQAPDILDILDILDISTYCCMGPGYSIITSEGEQVDGSF